MQNNKKLIWHVEDYHNLREVIKERLIHHGYDYCSFDTADNAIEALNNLKNTAEKQPNTIITDYDTKSDKNGLDVTKKAKEMDIPVIMLSASTGIKHQAEAVGATFFEKPYDSKELMAAIQKTTSQSSLVQDSVRTR